MSFNWEDYLTLARDLHNGKNPANAVARFRAAISRGYYAAFCLARDRAQSKDGLPPALAQGLAVYLNSTAVDEHFRRFSGHTQVNATDLRRLLYPSRLALLALGHWAAAHPGAVQADIDEQIGALA